MNIKKFLAGFAITFVVTLVATVVVTFLWSLIFHGAGAVDWETSFRFAVIFGIVFPLSRVWESKAAVK
jgi:hypothetical protein